MLGALLSRLGRLQTTRSTLSAIGQHGRARSLNMIGTRPRSVNFVLGCLFIYLIGLAFATVGDIAAANCVNVIVARTCLDPIVTSIIQMRKHKAAEAALGGAGAAGAEVEAPRPPSIVLPGEAPRDADEAVTPVPSPCLRTPRTRRGFGAVRCLRRSVWCGGERRVGCV